MSSVVENFKKYGVPLSDSMDIETISQVWSNADSSVREENAAMTVAINAANVNYLLSVNLFKAYALVKKAKNNMVEIIEAASATQQGQIQYPVLTAQEEASKLAVEVSNDIFNEAKEQIFT